MLESLSSPVAVKVLKKRVVRVKVWPVNRKYGSHTTESVYTPTKGDLDNYLNDIFTDQLNISFDSQVAAAADLDFETQALAQGAEIYGAPPGTPLSQDVAGGNMITMSDDYRGEANIIAGQKDPSSHINIYLVGGVEQGVNAAWDIFHQEMVTDTKWVGSTDDVGCRCWIAGGTKNEASTKLTKSSILDTMAHEIGHVFVGLGHPNEENAAAKGIAPLPRTDSVRRLMCRGEDRKRDGSSKLLVKAEWDEADARLKKILRETP